MNAAAAQLRGFVAARLATVLLALVPAALMAEPTSRPSPLPWQARLPEALEEAQRSGKPVLVDVGAEWCTWCRELDREMESADVQEKLSGWVRVRVDADENPEVVRTLSVSVLPALRALTPSGRVVASQNGYVKASDLAAWLEAHRAQAAPATDAGLADANSLDASAVAPLIAKLTDPDPVVAEAATRRLIKRPDLAASRVVAKFAVGKLRDRLAMLELLQAWHAPLASMDPWSPQTITSSAIETLRKWAAAAHAVPTTAPIAIQPKSAAVEIHAMLTATTVDQTQAARERLARFGSSLLPHVYAALKSAATDHDRERLTALRYRLVASDRLALGWPGGFDRLGSADAATRHRALDELSSRVTPDDEPLLLELFSDPDPFMREGSLRLLQAAGGEGTPAGLLRLLKDPEPNVRAAVLKQLADSPDRKLVPDIVKYVATEKDVDLVVHAVRFLREAKGRAAADCLMSLLRHESWRVRAEAAEALGSFIERYGNAQQDLAADIYAAMIKLLEDPDGFVVSRAVTVLRDGHIASAVEPMVRAAQKRPELAADVVKALTSGEAAAKSEKYVRQFCSSPNPSVRGAAISGLCSMTDDCGTELAAALRDPDAGVRVIAADAVTPVLQRQRPGQALINGVQQQVDWDEWLKKFRAGQKQPDWAQKIKPLLREMVNSHAPEEQVAAAVPLAATGDGPALKTGIEVARSAPATLHKAIGVLPWLPWDERIAVFGKFAEIAGSDGQSLALLARELALTPDERAAGPLWDLLSRGGDVRLAETVYESLIELYFGNRYYNREQMTADVVKPAVAAAKERLPSGTEVQRLVALAVLLTASPEESAAAAQSVLQDNKAPAALRRDAFQVLLLSQDKADAEKTAAAALADPDKRKIALAYLCAGSEQLQELRGGMYLRSSFSAFEVQGNGQPIVVAAPQGVQPETLKPLLKDGDSQVAAEAGYLLATLGDRSGLDPLLAAWRSRGGKDETYRRLVFRAISALDDDSLAPILEEIYRGFGKEQFEVREFYWTVRAMHGPNILKLRKRIRDEVGMQRLQ